MTAHALWPAQKRLHRVPLHRRRPRRPVAEAELLSLAGLVGAPVLDAERRRVGRIVDLVVRWDGGDSHPPLAGVIVSRLRKHAFVAADGIGQLEPDYVQLESTAGHGPVVRAPGLVALAHDVLDRQIVDVDGLEVVRVSDLVLGRVDDGIRLVGADVSQRTLLRRLGPARMRRRVAPDRVFDWASVGAFSVRAAGEAGSVLRLNKAAAQLSKLRPPELEKLLSDLKPGEGRQLGAAIRKKATP